MKCISCGNLIPDASTVCPYCNAPVEPKSTNTPVYNVENANASNATNESTNQTVVPQTPTAPVLPQDQGMSLNPLPEEEPKAPVGENVGATNLNSGAQPASPVAPVTPAPTEPAANVSNPLPSADAMQVPISATAAPTTAEVGPTASTNPNENEPVVLSNQGELTNVGMKIATEAPVKEKKSPKKLIIILVIILLLAIIVGGGVYAYFYEFKSGEKRIDAVVNNILSFTSSLKNDAIEKSSGSYDITLNVGANEEQYSLKLDGKYAVDLPSKMIDYTANVNSLSVNQELLPQPLNVELYLYDAKAYVLLQNFFSKYIYTDIEGYDDLFAGVEQNDIDYQLIINMFKMALKSGLKASAFTQTIEDVNIGSTKEKANVVRIRFDQANKRRIITAIINSLMNNKRGLEEFAKISDSTADALKESLQKYLDELEIPDENNDVTFEIITKLMGEKFLGLKLYAEETKRSIVLYPITNGYKLEAKEDTKNVLDLSYVSTSKRTKETIDKNYKIDAVIYISDVAYNINLELTQKKDINPKVEKVNVRESVNVAYLTLEDVQTIRNNLANFGELGMALAQQLDTLLPSPEVDPNQAIETPVTPDMSTNPLN